MAYKRRENRTWKTKKNGDQMACIKRVGMFFFVLFLVSCLDKKEAFNTAQYSDLFSIKDNFVQTYSSDGRQLSSVDKKEYERIVVLASPLSVFFTVLKGGRNVVGILNKSRVQSGMKNSESVGENGKIDVEKIISLQPDLIICNTYQAKEIVGVKVKKVLIDEYLEVSPKKRNTFSYLIGSLIGKEAEGKTYASSTVSKKYHYKSLGVSVCKLDNFGGTWFEPGCNTYISQLLIGAGANFKCIKGSKKSEKVSGEKVTLELAKSDYLLFLDWAKEKKGFRDRLSLILKFRTYPKNIIYCNTTESAYFEKSLVASADLIFDLHTVLQTKRKGTFFEILELEE